MRRAAKTDFNQAEIVAALRAIGASVQPLHSVGDGIPDLLVGMAGCNILLECKDGNKPPSARKLTRDQIVWHAAWRGQAHVVESVAQAITVVREVVGERYIHRMLDNSSFLKESEHEAITMAATDADHVRRHGIGPL